MWAQAVWLQSLSSQSTTLVPCLKPADRERDGAMKRHKEIILMRSKVWPPSSP